MTKPMTSPKTLNDLMQNESSQNEALMNATLKKYASVFETLSSESLHSKLAPLFDENVFFKDPFNQVIGKPEVLKIFEHMFGTLDSPQFKVKHMALAQETGYLHWTFNFSLPNQTKEQTIEGLSQVRFTPLGLIEQHIDYWDSTEHVYSKIPLLGWIIRQIAKRLAAC
ncbi:MAG: nuclear transport factor 2 family protein [Thiomicrorhabdus sp.]|nr:nuclear transport factor 2 family protein [Thiomicrorhabdus sp.]